MKPVGKPDALIGHVRFDERGWETGRRLVRQCSRPSSTLQSDQPAGCLPLARGKAVAASRRVVGTGDGLRGKYVTGGLLF
jgi:hypothetical protein